MNELTDKQLERLEKQIAKEYKASEKLVRKQLEKHVNEFEARNQQRLRLVARGRITEDDYAEWYEKELESGYWVRHAVEDAAREQSKANERAIALVGIALIGILVDGLNYGAYEVEKSARRDTKYAPPNKTFIERLIKDNPQLRPKVNIPKDRLWNERAIRRELIAGMKQGEGPRKIAKRFQSVGMRPYTARDIKNAHLKTAKQISREVAKKNYNVAVRNARSMINSAHNYGKWESYKRAEKLGLKVVKVWSATMDDRTRDSHAFLDGVSVKVNEEFPNGLMYPCDPGGSAEEYWNCRCELSMDVEGYERDWSDLSQRNTDHFIDDSYDDWKERHGAFDVIDGKWQKVV